MGQITPPGRIGDPNPLGSTPAGWANIYKNDGADRTDLRRPHTGVPTSIGSALNVSGLKRVCTSSNNSIDRVASACSLCPRGTGDHEASQLRSAPLRLMAYSSIETHTAFRSLQLLATGIVASLLLSVRVASALTGADTCAATTLSADSLSSPLVINDTTVGQVNDITHVSSTPQCTEAEVCNGITTGPSGGPIVGGRAFTSSGTGPDRVFRFHVDSACTLSISMLATAADLNVMFSRGDCGNAASDCSCIDDSDITGTAEQLTEITVVPLVDYYIIVDGFSGASDAFTLTLTRTLGTCNLTNEVCGNSNTAAGEACDDGNTNDCDGCRGDCSAAETGCGDGFICDAEVCDDDNTDDCDGCRGDCSAEETGCGDGFECGAEVCDDSNTDSCDGCNGDCSVVETGCGDSVICPGEDCDDSNTSNGDGCSSVCTEEATSSDAGSDGGMSLLDGSIGEDASAAGGTSSVDPDASSAGNSNGGNGNGGDGNGGGGARNLGGFGNLNPGGSAGSSSANPAATEESDSGCGCVTVGDRTATGNQWLTAFGMLTLLGLARRRSWKKG